MKKVLLALAFVAFVASNSLAATGKVMDVKRSAEGIEVNMKSDVLFARGKAELKRGAIEQINKFGDILVKYSTEKIEIIGYADSTGSDAINKPLSEKRANAVKNALLARKVSADNITAVGMGSANPIGDNATEEGRAKNRRVEMKLTAQTGSAKAVSEENALSKELSASQEPAAPKETAKPVAQESKSKVTFGLKVGYGFSNFLGDNISPNGLEYSIGVAGTTVLSGSVTDTTISGNWKNKSGAMGGFFAEVPVSKMFSIEPELLYVQKGAKPTLQGGDVWANMESGTSSDIIPGTLDVSKLSANMVLSANYIELPILVKANFKPADAKIVPSVFLGPEVGYLVSSELNIPNLINYDSRDLLKKWDFGFVVGVGVKVKDISFDLRYDLGLLNVYDKSGKTVSINQQTIDAYTGTTGEYAISAKLPEMKVRNSVAMLTVGYAFN
jgi:hypothetical protein